MSALVTRGCNEVQRLAVSLGGQHSTPTGLSGVGDTFGTCFGPLSRNRTLGVRLGKGETLEAILGSSTEVRAAGTGLSIPIHVDMDTQREALPRLTQVAEGVATASSVVQLIEKTNRTHHPESIYPIIYCVRDMVEGKRTPAQGVRCVAVVTSCINGRAVDGRSAWQLKPQSARFTLHTRQGLDGHAHPRGDVDAVGWRWLPGRALRFHACRHL